MASNKRTQDELSPAQHTTPKKLNNDNTPTRIDNEGAINNSTNVVMAMSPTTVTVSPSATPEFNEAVVHSITAFLTGDIAKAMFSALINAATAQYMSPLLDKITKLEQDNIELHRENYDLHKRVSALESLALNRTNHLVETT